MKRFFLSLASLAAACLTTSCFQNETTVHLNKDGSGTLVEETRLGGQALEMLAQFSQGLGGAGGAGGAGAEGANDPLKQMLSEDKAKARAAKLGEGVTFEKVEASEKNGFKGAKTTYKFADINKLLLNTSESMSDSMPEVPGQPKPEAKKTEPVRFKYEGGKLTVTLPQPEKGEAPANEAPNPAAQDPAAMEMAKQMFTGARVSVNLILEPGIAESTAAHVDGNKVTLMEMDLGKLMQNPEAFNKLSAAGNEDPAAAMEALKGVEGVKVETAKEITVTLK